MDEALERQLALAHKRLREIRAMRLLARAQGNHPKMERLLQEDIDWTRHIATLEGDASRKTP